MTPLAGVHPPAVREVHIDLLCLEKHEIIEPPGTVEVLVEIGDIDEIKITHIVTNKTLCDANHSTVP